MSSKFCETTCRSKSCGTHRVYTPEQEENGRPVARMVVYEAVTGI